MVPRMPLSVTHRNLANSYVRLREAAEVATDQISHLLRFYSVECGLKCAALRRQNLQSTAQLPELKTHDLRQLARDLGLSAGEYQDLIACRRQQAKTAAAEKVAVAELHEAWRYGAPLDPEDEKRSVAGLASLGQWCWKEIGR